MYLCDKAGSGKTQVALKICELFAGCVQVAAVASKAAYNTSTHTANSALTLQ